MTYPPFLPPEDRAERQLQALDEMIQIGLEIARLLPAQAAQEAELRQSAAQAPQQDPTLAPEPPQAPEAAPLEIHPASHQSTEPDPTPRPQPARRTAWPSVALCYARLQHAIADAIRLQRRIEADRDKAAAALYAARNTRRNELIKNPALRDRFRIFHTLELEIAAHAAADATRRRFLLEDLDDHMQHPDFGGQVGTRPSADIAAGIRRELGLPDQPAPVHDPPA
jgi:hypothetical protein